MALKSRALSQWGRLEKAVVLLVALNALAWLAQTASGWSLPGWGLLRVAGYVAAISLFAKWLRWRMRVLLWRVRNRMIVLFLFIGFVPVLLVSALAGLCLYLLTGQAAVHIATAGLDRRLEHLHDTATALVWSLRAAEASRRAAWAERYVAQAAESWPGLEAQLREPGGTLAFPSGAKLAAAGGEGEPRGIVWKENRAWLAARAAGAESFHATLLVPLSEPYLAGLAPGLGRITLFPLHLKRPGDARVGLSIVEDGETFTFERAPAAEPDTAPAVPEPAHRFDYSVTWGTTQRLESWDGSQRRRLAMLLIQTRPSAVYRLLFGRRLDMAQGVTIGFVVVAALFLIVELLSLVIGISITRTVTNSVHHLYEGTRKVERGELTHRIESGGHDQLADLSRSFNTMTESIERLFEESKERQRLASELAIAREVQEQLFPKAPPQMRGLEVLGVCHAARMVSGDYFDFVKMGDHRLALAIGDVAGKGISGALLMASIQSMLRTQLSAAAGAVADVDGAPWRFPAAELVARLNVQLYENTSPEKYATFFFAAYDDAHGLLTYTNAGHLPPVLIRNGEARRLEVNGMVVGAFPFAQYEQSEIALEPGDLLVAFTDGVTEPENEFVEEFGEPRLIELLVRHSRRPPRELIDEVIAAVSRWTGHPELQDDMTLLVARRMGEA